MKFNLKALALLCAFAAIGNTSNAQSASNTPAASGNIEKNGNGVLRVSKYTDLTGSPYFNEDWLKGDVKFKDGSVNKDILLRYDELADAIYTQVQGNTTIEFTKPVAEFTLNATDGTAKHFVAFPGNGKFSDNAFLQVLSDGNTKLLRKNVKAISEYKKDIGTAVVTREVVDNIDYYLLISGKIVRIKKDQKSVLAALGSKQPELETYIKANKLSLKKDDDLAKLITQYNTL